jgi:hypothetical protein
LNAEAALAPRATHGRKRGWSAPTVRDVLRSEIYRGVLIWGQTRKRDGWGQRVTRRGARQRPPDEWIRVERPDPQIVSEALWHSMQERLRQTRVTYLRSSDGRLHGRPVNGIAAKYLLTDCQPVQARQMLRKLLEGRLVFTPTADGTDVEFRGTGVLDPVLIGIVDGDGLPKASGSRWGPARTEAETLKSPTLESQLAQPSSHAPRRRRAAWPKRSRGSVVLEPKRAQLIVSASSDVDARGQPLERRRPGGSSNAVSKPKASRQPTTLRAGASPDPSSQWQAAGPRPRRIPGDGVSAWPHA